MRTSTSSRSSSRAVMSPRKFVLPSVASRIRRGRSSRVAARGPVPPPRPVDLPEDCTLPEGSVNPAGSSPAATRCCRDGGCGGRPAGPPGRRSRRTVVVPSRQQLVGKSELGLDGSPRAEARLDRPPMCREASEPEARSPAVACWSNRRAGRPSTASRRSAVRASPAWRSGPPPAGGRAVTSGRSGGRPDRRPPRSVREPRPAPASRARRAARRERRRGRPGRCCEPCGPAQPSASCSRRALWRVQRGVQPEDGGRVRGCG